MKNYACAIVLITVMMLAGCGSAVNRDKSAFIGAWEGFDPNGAKTTVTFMSGDMVSILSAGDREIHVNGSYRINSSEDPMWLDMFEFDHEELEDMVFKGIISLENVNRIMIEGHFSNENDSRERPASFSGSALTFDRKR